MVGGLNCLHGVTVAVPALFSHTLLLRLWIDDVDGGSGQCLTARELILD